MSGRNTRRSRRRDQLLGHGVTLAFALVLIVLAGAGLVALALFAVAMPITTGLVAAVGLWALVVGIKRRRRARKALRTASRSARSP